MSETITTISPITQKPILERKGIAVSDFDALLSRSTAAFASYSKQTTLKERQQIVRKALDQITAEADKLGEDVTTQMGRPISYTAKEVLTAVKRGEYMLKVSDEVLADTPGEAEEGFKRYIRKEPVGPVLVVSAWNYPYLILINSVVPALLAGSSLLIKPSPQTPTIAEDFVRIFEASGLPKDVMQAVHCGNLDTLTSLVERPEIRAIAFTGSVAGGLALQKAASTRVVPIGLELGGKDPAYIRSDVDLSWAAEEIVDGAIFNSGQSCCSIERVYVAESVYEPFLQAVVKVLEGYVLGDPMDKKTHLGPVVSVKSAQTIRAQVKEALEKGARSLTPDVFKAGVERGETFVRPELLADCTHDMRVMKEETFGPVIAVMKVKSDEEAVKYMNDSEFGLTASIWTNDEAAGEKLAESVEAGTVFVNRCDYPSPDLAWTGWKNSGRGVTLSKFGFEAFTRLKNFHVKTYPAGK